MPKKIIEDEEFKDVEKVVEKQPEIKEPKKKPYTVVLVTPKRIVYEVSKKIGYSTTPDIWNGKLKVGDTIYLEE
jgi:hypothetical protein